MRLDFTITMIPKAQKRTRNRGFLIKGGGRNGQDIARSMTYKDEGQDLEEQKFITLLYEHRPETLIQGAVILHFGAYLPMPKKSKKWTAAALAGEIRPETKPDLDNLEKHLKDCCTGVFWLDDKQVVECHKAKYYADVPRWEICIMTLDEIQVPLPAPEGISKSQQTKVTLFS
jgi:Holliday junction resolvase RusA-like endonuclease